MRSGKTNEEDYPAKGRKGAFLIAGLNKDEKGNANLVGTYKAIKIEFFGL